MANILAITSGKGGVGKSTVSVCLSYALRRLSKTVLLIDIDSGFRCLDLMLGVSDKVVFDLGDILRGSVPASEAIIQGKANCPDLIAAPYNPEFVDGKSLSSIVESLSSNYDFIILDFPAGMDEKLYRELPKSTLFLIVATPDRVCVRDAAAVSRILSESTNNRRLIINRFSKELIASGLHFGIDSLIDQSFTQLIGIVPNDPSLINISLGSPPSNKKTLCAFTRISKRLCGDSVPIPKPKKL